MGSSASKAAGSSARRFPSRAPNSAPKPAPPPPRQPAPKQTAQQAKQEQAKQPSAASTSKTDEIISDSTHPEASPAGFAERLHQMGIVNPTPTFSPSSKANPEITPSAPPDIGVRYAPPSNNPTVASLEARRRLQVRADAEFEALGRRGSPGREFLDVVTIGKALAMRERGVTAEEIEGHLNLKAGVVARLGQAGVTTPVSSSS